MGGRRALSVNKKLSNTKNNASISAILTKPPMPPPKLEDYTRN